MNRRRSLAFAALSVLSVVFAACSKDPGRPPSPSQAPPVPSLQAPTGTPTERADEKAPLPQGKDFAVLSDGRYVQVWRHPVETTDPKLDLDTRNPWGQRVSMLVSDAREVATGDTWYRVYLPMRPNEVQGWVQGKDVELVPEHDRLVVDLSAYSLTWYRNDKVADRFRVGVGQKAYPTATGTFYVWATLPQPPGSPYGVHALGLSGFSDVISDWAGGGRMAIHGTANPGDRGVAVSHGCVRVYNPDMQKLRRVAIGTPVLIKP